MMKPLVLGLGNDLLADDGVGILTVRQLAADLRDRADVVECCESGIRLLDYLMDYDRAILIDAICTGKSPIGTIIEIEPSELSAVVAPSPHYAGLPEILALAKQLKVHVPSALYILGVEVADPLTLGGEMTRAVREAIPQLTARVKQMIIYWEREMIHA
jgi:hydrogenase maturation protease